MMPFETPSALVNQLLSDFYDKYSTIMINGHTISTSLSESIYNDSKSKQCFTILQTTDQLLHYIHNFRFTIAFFLKNTSYAFERWASAKKIIKRHRIPIESFSTFILNLPVKILTFLHNRF